LFPTVCIFRPTVDSELDDAPPPDPEAMKDLFAHLYEACRVAGLPIGLLPIEVSLVVQPEEAADLVPPASSSRGYERKLAACGSSPALCRLEASAAQERVLLTRSR
jgi:hypothetical protein